MVDRAAWSAKASTSKRKSNVNPSSMASNDMKGVAATATAAVGFRFMLAVAVLVVAVALFFSSCLEHGACCFCCVRTCTSGCNHKRSKIRKPARSRITILGGDDTTNCNLEGGVKPTFSLLGNARNENNADNDSFIQLDPPLFVLASTMVSRQQETITTAINSVIRMRFAVFQETFVAPSSKVEPIAEDNGEEEDEDDSDNVDEDGAMFGIVGSLLLPLPLHVAEIVGLDIGALHDMSPFGHFVGRADYGPSSLRNRSARRLVGLYCYS
jgi:hypothetical protein